VGVTVVAVVTGAASGIGRATALALGARGLTVICADIDAERAGEAGVPYGVDVGDAAAMERFAAWVRDEHGAPAILVNNAGIGIGGSFFDHSVEDWRRIVDVNLMGVVHGCLFFGPQMTARGRGHIVNVASAAAFAPSRVLPAYGATKAGVLMLSESLRAELSGTGVGVSAVCPGFISTGIYRAARYAGMDSTEETPGADRASRGPPGPGTGGRRERHHPRHRTRPPARTGDGRRLGRVRDVADLAGGHAETGTPGRRGPVPPGRTPHRPVLPPLPLSPSVRSPFRFRPHG
jgi:NAD(P)-dependent dehydrogenase (short-subunit alcohol dehydrogenase family)